MNNELFLGSEDDKILIKNHILNTRQSYNYLNNSFKEYITDLSFMGKSYFDYLISLFVKYIKNKYNYKIILLPFERYVINSPTDLGGFYGSPIGGYKHIEQVGYTTLLNTKFIENVEVLDLEVIRNYLHDCLHFNTFKSYKYDYSENKVYRYQYGINYRNFEGISYSSISATNLVPYSINLNILMDGFIQLIISDFFSSIVSKSIDIDNFKKIDLEILNEILNISFKNELFFLHLNFYRDVIDPAKKFINYWNGDSLKPILFIAMMTGNLENIKEYLFTHSNISWEEMFKQIKYYEN